MAPLSPALVKNNAYVLHPNAANTPTDTNVSIDASAWRRFLAAARWNGQAAQVATGALIAKASHCQLRNWSADTIDSNSTGAPSTPATTRRRNNGSPAASAEAAAPASPASDVGTRAP